MIKGSRSARGAWSVTGTRGVFNQGGDESRLTKCGFRGDPIRLRIYRRPIGANDQLSPHDRAAESLHLKIR